MENFQVSGPQDERDQGAYSFPPESPIVAEPDVHTGKTSVGMHDQIQVFQELNWPGEAEGQDHLTVHNPAVNPQNDFPNFPAWGVPRVDKVLVFQHEPPRELIVPE